MHGSKGLIRVCSVFTETAKINNCRDATPPTTLKLMQCLAWQHHFLRYRTVRCNTMITIDLNLKDVVVPPNGIHSNQIELFLACHILQHRIMWYGTCWSSTRSLV
mmetsp:Transcript_16038/g.33298  ORF Transcript_16038/g.33298 Transcript_16038/m.33298 type:complete len:105 (-) Transcript_16038:49-363(-)